MFYKNFTQVLLFSFNFTYQTFCSCTISFLFSYAPIIKCFNSYFIMHNTVSCSCLLFSSRKNSSLPLDFYLLNGKLSKLSEKHMYLPAICIIYHKWSTSTDYSHLAHLTCLATCFENELVTKSPGVYWHCCCHRSEALKIKGASNPSKLNNK